MPGMKRREFVALLGGVAASARPSSASAQRSDRQRRIGVLMPLPVDDPEARARFAAFAQGIAQFGWADGRNVRIDTRSGEVDSDRLRGYAAELAALSPDVILANGSAAVGALQQAAKTLPIVFVAVIDPVGARFIQSMARPGGNITGFTNYEYGISGKWLELLKEIAPRLMRVAVIHDPAIAAGGGQLGTLQAVAPSLGLELSALSVRDTAELDHGVASFAREPNGGLIVTGSTLATLDRMLLVTLAARHKLPAIYSLRFFVASGGLISYGPDRIDQYRRAAGYVDRILRGEKPADLPVQAPVKYELTINLKTAKALGLDIPPTLLARADEVIE
jgi:putative ABC transport system substrate-binding protein